MGNSLITSYQQMRPGHLVWLKVLPGVQPAGVFREYVFYL